MRVPRAGGSAQVFSYPSLDSVVWTSSEKVPALDHVLAFNDDGTLAFVDARGLPGRIDFRADNVVTASRTKLTAIESENASAIYGFAKDGSITRLTPTGDWSFKPPRRARAAIPLATGALLIVTARDSDAVVYRIFPPEEKIRDSATVAGAATAPWALAGDRLYFELAQSLNGVRTRDLQALNDVALEDGAHSLVATPSGDRLYVLPDSGGRIDIVDRYRERVVSQIKLPERAAALRIDPLGRYLLVKHADADSAWVVAIGTDRLVGEVRSAWRDDLPLVAPDGAIVIADGADVVTVNAETLAPVKRVAKGARDFWYAFAWNGFRPRSASLDQPVQFDVGDSAQEADSSLDAMRGAFTPVPQPDSVRPPTPVTPSTPTPAATRGWVVQFGALLSEERARELAATIRVRGTAARVQTSTREGTAIYRVVLGPYGTRDEADRIGRESRQSYYVYEASP